MALPGLIQQLSTRHHTGRSKQPLQAVYARCAGLDVHKKTVLALVLLPEASGTVTKETRTLSTMTAELLRLEAWLADLQVDHLARESPGG